MIHFRLKFWGWQFVFRNVWHDLYVWPPSFLLHSPIDGKFEPTIYIWNYAIEWKERY